MKSMMSIYSHRRRRSSLTAEANTSRPQRGPGLLTRRQAMELIHTWDQQILRLRHRVEELEEQNEQLRDLLKDAVRICDDAITTGHWIVAPSRFADTYRILLCHSVSLRSQVQLSWRWLLFSMTQLPLPYRRDSPKVGWPFEPVHDGSVADRSVGALPTQGRPHRPE